MVPFSDLSKSWAQASWKVFEASMWVTGGPYTIKGWNILFVFQKIKIDPKNMENPKIVENVNFIFLKFMTFWKKFYQYFPYFGQLWRNELLLTKIGPVPTNLLTKSENVRVWKLFFIKIYHQKINSRGQQDQNGVYWALSQLTQRTTGLMKSWPPHSDS